MKHMANYLKAYTFYCPLYFVPTLPDTVIVPRLHIRNHGDFCLQGFRPLLLPAYLLCQWHLPEGLNGARGYRNCLVHRNTDWKPFNLSTHRLFLGPHQAWQVLELQRHVPCDRFFRFFDWPYDFGALSPHSIYFTSANEDKDCSCRYIRSQRFCCHYRHNSGQLHLSA
jgi:hypothetical protein